MIVRRFEQKDYLEIMSWLECRKMPLISSKYLPDIGFIVDGTACGFLIETNCRFGILDFFISNKEAPKSEVKKAIIEILYSLTKEAHNMKIEMLKGDTKFESLKEIGLNFGFKSLGMTENFYKEL